MRRGVRRPAAVDAIAAGSRPGPDDGADRRVLGRALEAPVGPAGRRRAARRAPGRRPAPLARSSRRHRAGRSTTRRSLSANRRADPDDTARRRRRSRRGVQRLHAADRALAHARTPLLGHRPGHRDLPILNDHPARADQSPGPGRTPQRPDGHRLGPLAQQPRVPRPQRRTARPRLPAHPSSSGTVASTIGSRCPKSGESTEISAASTICFSFTAACAL